MDRAESTGDFEAAAEEASALFRQVTAWVKATDQDLIFQAAYARRLMSQLGQAEGIDRVKALRYMRANETFAHALVFLVRPEDNPSEVYALSDRLQSAYGRELNTYATLAAAICVVHDTPLERRVNENRVASEDPVELFEYFRSNEKRMLFGIRNVPAELLIYVVDSTATIREMKWALKNYAGDRSVGERFFDIEYDWDHFRRGAEKKVTRAGFNLPNILTYGGVCADQAYFAVSIGKSIGVPTAYTRGRSSVVSHAWVGFLQEQGNRAGWNFNEGRYAVYRGVRGVVQDPQTRELVPDSVVSLLGELVGYSMSDRHAAAALIDAADILIQAEASQSAFDTPPLPGLDALQSPRSATKDAQLELLEAGLRRCPGSLAGWDALAGLASGGKLTLSEKKKWSSVLMNLCGDKYPDFTLAVLEPMIRTIEDPHDQNDIWETAGSLFTTRKDLSARVLMNQGHMWAQQGEYKRAGRCFEAVVQRHINDGPFVLEALDEIESILRESGMHDQVLRLYDQTWARVLIPKRMSPAFRKQSNWYKIGKRYAERLRDAGYNDRAAQAEAAIRKIAGG